MTYPIRTGISRELQALVYSKDIPIKDALELGIRLFSYVTSDDKLTLLAKREELENLVRKTNAEMVMINRVLLQKDFTEEKKEEDETTKRETT